MSISDKTLITFRLALLVCMAIGRVCPCNEIRLPWWRQPPYYGVGPDETGEQSDLVCVVEGMGWLTTGPLPLADVPTSANIQRGYFRLRVLYTLRGEASVGDEIMMWAESMFTGGADLRRIAICFLNKLPEGCYVATRNSESCFRPPARLRIPPDAPVRDKIVLLKLAGLAGSDSDKKIALLALSPVWARRDSPYYDPLQILKTAQSTSPSLAALAISIRMSWGDLHALDDAIAYTQKAPASKLSWSFSNYGIEAVTTLNLILEGKRWPWMEGSRTAAAERLAILQHPSSLPYLIAALNDPNQSIQSAALAGAQAIRIKMNLGRGNPYTSTDVLDNTKPFLPDGRRPISENGKRRIEEMKHWWATEGRMLNENRMARK